MMPEQNPAKFYHGCITLAVMVLSMFSAIVFVKADPQVPLIFGCFVAGVEALLIGFSWNHILEGMLEGITHSLEAILILILIGMLVGTWIAGGTMPTMIYYGLQIMTPKIFLPAAVVLCTLVAFAIGSWGTIGTIGLAFMGIGSALGLPAPVVAGAIISGAYAGEMVSPLSDATNLSSAVVGDNVFDICHRILKSAVPGMILSLVIFTILGIKFTGNGGETTGEISQLLHYIDAEFAITPLALAPIIVMTGCLLLKLPAIPSMFFGSVAGMICALILQHQQLQNLFSYCYKGYKSHTGNTVVDGLLSAGGIEGMFYTISIIIIAMAFGGIMSYTGQMAAVIAPLVSLVQKKGGMSLLSTITSIVVNVIIPDQYLGISLPGEMYAQAYQERGIDCEHLACSILGGGAVSSPLVPWNTCGLYCTTILGVATMEYIPYAVFCLVLPVITVILGYLGSEKTATEKSNVGWRK